MAVKAHKGSLLTSEDAEWVSSRLLPYLGLDRVDIAQDVGHTAVYPDIWVQGNVITVTPEWARQDVDERRKRLLHEGLHIIGFGHGAKERAMGYYSKPEKDVYTRELYEREFK